MGSYKYYIYIFGILEIIIDYVLKIQNVIYLDNQKNRKYKKYMSTMGLECGSSPVGGM